jgi:hypothetical protein
MQQRLDACMVLHTLHNLLHLMQLHRLTAQVNLKHKLLCLGCAEPTRSAVPAHTPLLYYNFRSSIICVVL